MRYMFIIPALVDEYSGAVEDRWGNRAAMRVYLLSHWSKVSLCMVAQSQRYSYKICIEYEDIVSCEWMKELFINSSDPALIKRVEEKYEALNGLYQGGMNYLKISLDDMLNMSDVIITSLQ